MDIEEFRRLAAEMLEDIPPAFQQGVDAVEVTEEPVPHPDVPGVFTLGECRTEAWPSGYDEGELRSRLLLHHGSFRALAERDPSFDWTAELWETILHELLHHREWAAGEMSLDLLDWVVEQNHRRHAGLDFDPEFYRALPADEEGVVRVDAEAFVEGMAADGAVGEGDADDADDGGAAEEQRAAESIRFSFRGGRYRLRPGGPARPGGEPPGQGPPPGGDGPVTHFFVRADNLLGGRLWVVVRRPASRWKRWLGLAEPRPAESRARAYPVPDETSERRD